MERTLKKPFLLVFTSKRQPLNSFLYGLTEQLIDRWIIFYNSDRPHTAHDKRTPDEAYYGSDEMRKAA